MKLSADFTSVRLAFPDLSNIQLVLEKVATYFHGSVVLEDSGNYVAGTWNSGGTSPDQDLSDAELESSWQMFASAAVKLGWTMQADVNQWRQGKFKLFPKGN